MASFPTLDTSVEPEHPRKVISKKDRQVRLVKLFIIVAITIATVVLTSVDVYETAKIYNKEKQLKKKLENSIAAASLIHNLQKERGLTAMILGFKIINTKRDIEPLQYLARQETDEGIRALGEFSENKITCNGSKEQSSGCFTEALNNYRSKIDKQEEDSAQDIIQVTDQLRTYSSWINEYIAWLPQYTAHENLRNYANLVFAYQMIIQSKEDAGMERALGGLHFVQGKNFSTENHSWFNEKRIRAKNTLSTAFSFSDDVKSIYDSLIREMNATLWMPQMVLKRQILSSRNVYKPSTKSATEWFNLMTKYNNLMLQLQLKIGKSIQALVSDQIDSAAKTLIARSILLGFTFIVVPSIIISLIKVQNAFYIYTLSLFDKVGLKQGRTDFIMKENARHVESKYAYLVLPPKNRPN